MKRLLTILSLALAGMSAMAQSNPQAPQAQYVIKGKAPAILKKVYLVNVVAPYGRIDSAEVKNGAFQLKGTNAKDNFFGVTGEENVVTFINDGTPLSIDLNDMTLKGSPLNEKLNKYDRELDAMGAELEPVNKAFKDYQSSGNHTYEEQIAFLKTLQPQIEAVQGKQRDYIKALAIENRDNIIPAIFVNDLIGHDEADTLLKEYFDPSFAYANHPAAARAKDYLEKEVAKNAIIGTQFIDLEENDVDGRPHKLSEYVGKGNYVLIDFWASWCGPCMREMPNVKANYDKYHAKGFEVVGLSFDRDADAWKKAISEKELNWIHLSDLKFWQSIAAQTYHIQGIPSSLLVDPTGKIVARDLREEALGQKLAEIYGE